MTAQKPTRSRRYYYGLGKGKGITAYTANEWGMGGAARSGSYSTASPILLLLGTIILTPVALVCLAATIIGILALNLALTLIALLFTVLFGLGAIAGIGSLREELQARKIRRQRGLAKAWYTVSDDQARRWFEEHPRDIAITRENFPDSIRPFPGEEGYRAE